MKLDARQRWLVLGGLLIVTLAVGAWLGEGAAPPATQLVVAAGADSRAAPASARARGEGARGEALAVNLEKFKSRDAGEASRDPFATQAPLGANRTGAPGAPSGPVAPPSPPSAPALPFTYIGKLLSEGNVAVFLTQGERNLVVHEGDTIDALYRVEHIAEGGITLVYLPLEQRQTLVIGEPQ